VAGPIMRAHTLLPQVTERRSVRAGDWEEGLYLVLVGLFKKIVIADNMAPIANSVFQRFADGSQAELTGVDALIGVYAFAMQIYGDFSGYSGVARGISKWLGFELVVNFRLPYLAVSPSDFWQRWHISLSSWLRDYLYIPLGGSRGSTLLTYRNLMITMLLGGLWHGASWTFVAWGFYHGAILCLFRWLGIRDPDPKNLRGLRERVWYAGRVLFMFHLTRIGWLLFRAETFGLVTAIATSIVTDFVPTSAAWPPLALMAFYCGPLFLLECWLDGESRVERLLETNALPRGLTYAYTLAMMLVFPAAVAAEFIYFQF
jgi:D-alanyl-lipoteichoic acid acyltransferase DltB (MBOAT superfamily)